MTFYETRYNLAIAFDSSRLKLKHTVSRFFALVQSESIFFLIRREINSYLTHIYHFKNAVNVERTFLLFKV